MIYPVSSFTNSNQKCKTRAYAVNPKQSPQIAFCGESFPSGFYRDEEIAGARAHLKKWGDQWEKKLYSGSDSLYDQTLKESTKAFHKGATLERITAGVQTMGFSEKLISHSLNCSAGDHVKRVAKLIPDLLNPPKSGFNNRPFSLENYEDDVIADARTVLKKYGDKWEPGLFGELDEGGPDSMFYKRCEEFRNEFYKGASDATIFLKAVFTMGTSDIRADRYALDKALRHREKVAIYITDLIKKAKIK